MSANGHSGGAATVAGIMGLVALSLAWPGSPVSAQQDTVPTAPVRLFEWRFVGEVALGTAGSLVLLPVDERVRSWMQDPARQGSATLDRAAHALLPLGLKRPLVAAAALYGVGLVAGSPTAADVGLHVGEAIAGAGATTIFLKILAGREGPRRGGPYEFGKGDILDFGSRSKAFPSGNTTVAFALAGALTEEASQHWPGTARWVGPVTFTMATGVAAALMYHNDHWASDVLAGAVVGTLVSRRVVRSLHTGGAGLFSRLDPILLPRRDGGATAGFSVAFRRGRP